MIDGNARDVLKGGYYTANVAALVNFILCEGCFAKIIETIKGFTNANSNT